VSAIGDAAEKTWEITREQVDNCINVTREIASATKDEDININIRKGELRRRVPIHGWQDSHRVFYHPIA